MDCQNISNRGGNFGTQEVLFEPDLHHLGVMGINGTDSLIQVDDSNQVWVNLDNRQHIKVHLPEGCLLGAVTSVEELTSQSVQAARPNYGSGESQTVCNGKSCLSGARLSDLMNLSALKMPETEQKKLWELVCKFQDIFGLNEQELGKTNLVKHSSKGPIVPLCVGGRRLNTWWKACRSKELYVLPEVPGQPSGTSRQKRW